MSKPKASITPVIDIKAILEGPYVSAPDEAFTGAFSVNIFLLLGRNGMLCVGRYDLMGDGKTDVSKILTMQLTDILDSIQWTPADAASVPAEILAAKSLSNMVLVVGNNQYFIDSKTSPPSVLRRSDEFKLAVRPEKVRASINKFMTKGYAMLSAAGISIASTSLGNRRNSVPDAAESDWLFPAAAWKEVYGIMCNSARPFAYISGRGNCDSIMAPDVFDTNYGVYEDNLFYPIWIKSGTKQTNFITVDKWSILGERYPSRQDENVQISNLLILLKNSDGTCSVKVVSRMDVTAKPDYWQGEILRVKFYQGAGQYSVPELDNKSALEIEEKILGGAEVVQMLICRPDLVKRPESLTIFNDTLIPETYDVKKNRDIVIEARNGVWITKVSIAEPPKTIDQDSMAFAMIGKQDAKALAAQEFADLSTANKFLDAITSTAKPSELIINNLFVEKDGKSYVIGEKLGDDMIISIKAAEFDANLNPTKIEIGFDARPSMAISVPAGGIRFNVPGDIQLSEFQELSKGTDAMMEKKAAADFIPIRNKWVKKQKLGEIYESLGKFAKLVNTDAMSGRTLINIKALDAGEIKILGEAI